MTSNVMCKTVPSYSDHHIVQCFEASHPCVICTDDSGIFKSSLSMEYYITSQVLNLDKLAVYNLARSCIDYIFGSEEDKTRLCTLYDEFDISKYR